MGGMAEIELINCLGSHDYWPAVQGCMEVENEGENHSTQAHLNPTLQTSNFNEMQRIVVPTLDLQT